MVHGAGSTPAVLSIYKHLQSQTKVDAIVYTTSDTGSKRIAKAVNTSK